MHLTALLAAPLALLASTTTAIPTRKLFSGQPFQITELTLQRVNDGNATLTFKFFDPDPLSNATTTCVGTWPYDSAGWPTGSYDACNNTDFSWHMAEFESWTDFRLGLEHVLQDPSIGQPPYDHVTNFAKGAFNASSVSCKKVDGSESCEQVPGTVVTAPITQSIAKRR